MRVFLGWLRGERRHCSKGCDSTLEEEEQLVHPRARYLVCEGTGHQPHEGTLAGLASAASSRNCVRPPNRLDALRTP